jgi:hypothetical protein
MTGNFHLLARLADGFIMLLRVDINKAVCQGRDGRASVGIVDHHHIVGSVRRASADAGRGTAGTRGGAGRARAKRVESLRMGETGYIPDGGRRDRSTMSVGRCALTVIGGVTLKLGEGLRGAVSVVDGRAGDVAREPTQACKFTVSATVNAGLLDQLLTPQATGQQVCGGTDTSSVMEVRKRNHGERLGQMWAIPVLLLPLILLLGFTFTLLLHAVTDRGQEGLQVSQEVLLCDTSLPIQEEEQLTLHQVHLGQREAKSLESLHSGVPSPMLVLGARVVQVLGSEDERGEEDPVDSASHALGNRWKAGPKAAQVHQ